MSWGQLLMQCVDCTETRIVPFSAILIVILLLLAIIISITIFYY